MMKTKRKPKKTKWLVPKERKTIFKDEYCGRSGENCREYAPCLRHYVEKD